MSSSVSVTSEPLAALRWIDVILVVATRLLAMLVERRAAASDNPKTVAGLMLFTGLGRAWLLGLSILVVGLAGSRKDGLTAAIVVAAAFTLHLALGIAMGPKRRKPE